MRKSGIKRQILLLFAIVCLCISAFINQGCSLLIKDKQSVSEKKQQKADEKASAEYEKAREQHYKIQSKTAKKMMKRTKKQASDFNKPMKRKGFNKTKCN
ncbi:MAG: hypothetical protein WCI92_11530 [Bacteroidota bacterium]